MKKILLAGSSGFIGTELLKSLSTKYRVTTLGRSENNIIIDLQFEYPDFKECYDMVIHSFGKAHSLPNSSADDYYGVNVVGTSNLLKGLENSFIPKKFIYISSVAVYGLTKGLNIGENSPLDAEDLYGKSKIQAEKLVEEWCLKHKVLLTILRLPLVVGNNSPGNLGDLINIIKKGFYFNVGGGKARRSMVLIQDVVKYVEAASRIGGIYNLTDGYHPSFSEFSYNICLQLGKEKPKNMPFYVAKIIAKLGDMFGSRFPINTKKLIKMTSDLTFDDGKARECFGWNPVPVLEGFNINLLKK